MKIANDYIIFTFNSLIRITVQYPAFIMFAVLIAYSISNPNGARQIPIELIEFAARLPKTEAPAGHIYLETCGDSVEPILTLPPALTVPPCQNLQVKLFAISDLAAEAVKQFSFLYMVLVVISGAMTAFISIPRYRYIKSKRTAQRT